MRSATREVNAAEQPLGGQKPRIQRSTGPAEESLDPPELEVTDKMPDPGWASNMAMAEELVEVVVHDTTDKAASKIIEVFNNGIPQRFIRGQTQTVKRKFVATLANAKQTAFSQEKYMDADGVEAYRNVPHTALTYPFSVIRDDNPRGADWLKNLLAQA